jgi:hypothetical protein
MLPLPVLHGGICLICLFCQQLTAVILAKQMHSNLVSRLRLLNSRGPMMLRVETQQLDGALICRLEGRFTGEGAEEVRRLVTHCDSELEFVVDLTDVMFIDAIGEEVLLFVKRLGAQFVAETAYSRDVCERLELPFSGKLRWNLQVSLNSDGNGHRPRRR